MANYKYTAISKDGQKVTGVIEGYSELDAVDRIKQTCNVVLSVKELKEKQGLLNMDLGRQRLNSKAFTVMCSQFAIIINAGIPIARAVQLIAEKTTDKPLKKMLKLVSEDVESGRSLASAFEERGGNLLPQTFVETIRAGEESGNIDKAFQKKGIGTTVLKHFIQSAFTSIPWLLNISLQTNNETSNEYVLKFYRDIGFVDMYKLHYKDHHIFHQM